ncbi:HYR domain-containing protein [Salinimicrobium sp. GXAS 041]|uniref:HYR domain-containing protein n=1 Tax=Salinimicrobium sp. GXAS 041 TaxID=3400806 RepID=UPI003C78F7BD
MEQYYLKDISVYISKKTLLLLAIFMGSMLQLSAQVRAPFTQRTSEASPNKKIYSINGDFTMLGNTNMTVHNYSVDKMNSLNYMLAVDSDTDWSTSNSSSATLVFSNENNANPECTNILFAGLYWTGRTNSNVRDSKKRSIRFKAPNGIYQNIFASAYNTPGDDNMYASYAEVTDIVKAGGTGEYWVADMAITEGDGGSTGYYGGWGMVVIYENAQMNLRDVTVFDGYAYVEGNATRSFELPISGFNTAQEGPVNMKLGMMAGEGDRGITGDYFDIQKRNSNSWKRLSHDQNATNNFFNSSIKTDAGRNPNLLNNTGMDISMFTIDNPDNSVIGNKQTSTKFRYGSTQDTYIIFNMVMSVDAYVPDFEAVVSTEQSTAAPGEEVEYTVGVYNKGSEEVDDAKITIPVPFNYEFVQNSGKAKFYGKTPSPNNIIYDPAMGPNGSIIWDIGTLPLHNSTTKLLGDLHLKFKVTEDCTILKNSTCGNQFQIPLTGSLSGKGAITGAIFNNIGLIQGYQDNGQCYGQPITDPLLVTIDATEFIQNNCQATPERISFSTCNVDEGIAVQDIISEFPAGTRFYDNYPVNSGSNEITGNFPTTPGTTAYYAILEGSTSCYIPFDVTVDEITSVPQVENVEYCVGESAAALTATPSMQNYTLFFYTSEDGTAQSSVTPSTSEAGEFTYYVAEGESSECISQNKAAIKVRVFAKPEVTAPLNVELQGCGTEFNNSSIPEFSSAFRTISRSTFERLGGTIASEKAIQSILYKDRLEQDLPSVITRTFRITSECGSQEVQQVIKVIDKAAPEGVSLEDITAQCAANVEAPVTIDNCDGEITGTTNDSVNFTEQGEYQITWTFEDKSGNITTAVQNVTIEDTVAPEITCANDIFDSVASGSTTAVVTYDAPVASDNCEFTVEQTAGLASGSEFPLGTTTNTFVVTDGAGNTATCSFDVVITDDEDPTLECPAPNNVNVDAGICGAVVEFTTPEGFDNSGEVTVTQIAGPLSGEVFPVGTTTVTFQVEDASGNTATCSFDVTVTDNEAPEITSVLNITQDVDSDSCSATVEYELPTATDNCEGVEVTLTEGLASGSEFPLGETTVTYTATDASGNEVTTTFTVTVVDNIAPEITCVNDIFDTVASGSTTAVVTYDAPVASDNCEFTVEQTAGLASGSEFPLGTTTNTFVVTDGAGNTATCSFDVVITDDEDPTLECPAPINVNVDSGICGAVVEFTTPEGFDNSGDATVTQIAGPVSGETFPVGITTVTFRVQDASGNTATCSFDVTVTDNEDPEITSISNITENVDVDSCSAIVEYELPTATDNCEGVTVELTEGLASGSEFPLGETTVTYTATDASGNEVTTTFTVTVVDNIAPEITCVNDIFDNVASGSTTAVVIYDAPVASDNCSYTVEQTAGLASGSEFPLGTTTNTFVVTDGAGNTATCSFDVVISDNEDPTITCPNNIDVNVDVGICGAVVEFSTPEGFDNSGEVTVTQIAGPASGETFPVGSTTVTFQVEDASGNTATCSFDVTVNDNEAPEITSVANITQNVDVASCSANVEYELPTATDNCEGVEVTLTEGLSSGETFPLGETTVTYTATDAAGNKVTTTFTVTVVDNIAPEITCVNDIFDTVASGSTTAVVTYDAPVASDNCEFTVEQTVGLPSGSEFPLGTTTNTFVVTDGAGNTATCSFTVTITDDEDPTLECTAPINVNVDAGICGAVVEFATPEGSDNSGDVTVTQIAGPASGETFPVGTTTVTFQVEDASGNTATCSFDVTVNDNEVPEITSIANITQNVDVDSCSATVEYELPTATDNCEGVTVELTEGLASGSEFPLGETTVTYTATDASGNEVTTTFTVTVVDNIAPEITCVNDIFETVASGSTTAVVNFDAPVASDNCSFTVEQTAGLASGSEFPLGTTTNTFVVTDGAGNTATCSFDVVITDDEDPTLECPAPINVNVDAGICGAVVEFTTPEGSDNSGEVTVIQIAGPVSGEVFPVGITTVTFQVEDASGNTATCSFDVTVTDNEAPEITSVSNITQDVDLASCSATVEYELPTATDNCEGVTVELTEGLASGSEFPLGETTVTYTATDASGNEVTTTFTVTVVDNIAPEITCVNDIFETVASGSTTAVVNFDAPVASDNCSFTVEQTAGLASGSEFPLGTTTNTFVVTDGAGNTATCSFDVVITDDEDPTLECPENINVNVDAGICGAVVEFAAPEGFDNSGKVTVTQIAGPVSGSVFPVGTTTVTFQVEDTSGNTATCSFDVTVNDNEAPEITSISNITENVDVDSCSAIVEYELPTATDNCEGVTVELTEGLASGSEFPLGETTVTYTATDAAGNKATTTFTVTIEDTVAPEITCVNDIFDTVASGSTSAVVTYDAPVASDNCEFTVEQTAGLASGSEFPLGTTTNTFVVTDVAGNTASCSFDVVIADDEDPTITCPNNIDVNVDAGICGAVVEFSTPEGFDNSGEVTVTQIAGPVSGETFPVGTTTVTFQVEDASGNTSTCSFDVTVKDNEAPEITSVANITQNVDVDSCSATVEYELPTATDNCEGVEVTLTEGLASGSEFPLGETTVTYTATDISGNEVSTTFTVTVVDNIAPEITCVNDIFDTVASGSTTAVVTYDAPVASDNCSYTVEQTAGLASGSEFPLGTTTNTFVVTDAAGNNATCSFDVTITDDEDPTLECPENINVNVDAGICGAVVEFTTPEGSDNSGEVTVTQIAGPVSGSVFPVGTTTVTFQVEDASGNTATCSFDVTVNDNEAPKISSIANITQNVDVDSCSATVKYELPTATDNCEGVEVTLTEGLASGNEFPLGETTVTYTATDASGNEVTTTFTVTVVDNIAPEITCVNDIFTTVASGSTTAVVTYDTPVASDNCSFTVEQTAGLASGSEFPLGTTTNTFVVTDGAGNTATCSFDVVITDDEDPTLECPENINVNVDAGICGAVVEFATPEGSDNSGDVTVTQITGPVSGEVFPVGTTTVTFQVEDASGNKATCSFDVTVNDNEAPTITSVANITQNVDVNSCSATVEYELPTATDNCEGVEITLTEGLASGSEFPLGETTVTYTATDASGNEVTTTFTVTVVDNIAPEITCVNDIFDTVDAGSTTAVVTYDAPVASDNCEFTVEQTAGLASGSAFPLGTTTNTFVVTDSAGNTATCSFTVTITDDEDPTLECPAPINVNVDAGICGAVVEFITPEGSDNSGEVTITQIAGPVSGEVFPVGTTKVTFQVEDASGNTATCSFDVTVNDNEAPEITSVANITQNVDVDSCSATVEYELPTATDNCEGVTVELTEGLASGSEFPLGETTVTYTATDASGNEVTTTFTVTVLDNIAPEISCTNDIFDTVASGSTTAVVTYDAPVASDNCEFTVEQTAGLASGSEFPLGTTTNTFVVTDAAGNTATCSFDVTITDDEDPTITCPENIDINVDAGICGAVVEFATPEGFDNSGEVTVTQIAGPVSGETFPVGITTVTFQVEDASGNTATCSFSVTVTDNEAPEITSVSNITENVDVNSCSATVEYELPTATDNCEGVTVELTEGLASGSEFPLGETTVTYTATDASGNDVTTTFTVTVVDNIAPEISCVNDIFDTVASGSTTAVVTYDAPVASDNCSYTVEQTAGLASGSEFPLGTTTNTFVVTDGAGNTATCSFDVVITDDEDPTLECPAPINVNVDAGICGAVVEFSTPEGFDNSGAVTVTQIAGPLSGETFPVGTTTVTFQVEDASGNTAPCSFDVTVTDNEAPEITSVANITQNVDVNSCSATVEYELPTATDNCEGVTVELNEGLASGSEFPLGETTVSYTATDTSGNEVTTTFTVTVIDNIAPVIPELETVYGDCAVTITAPSTIDGCAGEITGTTADALTYDEQGEYVITWSFNDGNGNTSTAIQNVIIEDNSAPEWTSALPSDVTVSCNDIPEAATLTAEDNCGVEVIFSEEMEASDCASEYLLTRTWTATDSNDNSIVHTQIIYVEDNVAPALTGNFEEVINITCEEIPMVPELEFTDNCSSEVNVEFEESIINAEDGSFTITRTWTATDCPGNEAVITQTVNVNPAVTEIETTTVDLCTEDVSYKLSDLLIGEYNENGTWEDPQQTGALQNGIIEPSLLAVGMYSFDYVINDGECSSTTTVQVGINDDCVVLPCGVDDIKGSISKTVTPNGDQKNDRFEIGLDLDCGFTYDLQVFNRWGNKVYEAKNYQNDWTGTSINSVTGSNQLPSGTYYYIITINQGGFEPIQGYIYLGTK